MSARDARGPEEHDAPPALRRDHAVDPRGGAAVERLLLVGRGAGGDALEGVPQLGVAARLLVGREVALEHAAVGSERLDAGLDIGPPGVGQLLRGGRRVTLVETEAERGHAEPAQLDVDVGALRELGDALAPAWQDLRRAAGIGPDAQNATDMVHDDRLPGKGPREIDQVRKLRMEVPGIEGEAKLAEFGETFAELRIEQAPGRDRARHELADDAVVPRGAIAH